MEREREGGKKEEIQRRQYRGKSNEKMVEESGERQRRGTEKREKLGEGEETDRGERKRTG